MTVLGNDTTMGTFDKIGGVWIAEEALYQMFDMFA